MTCGWDWLLLQFGWYDQVGDGEWTWLGSVILGSWVLLTTLLGNGLMLLTCFFFVFMLENPPWVPVTLTLSESMKDISWGGTWCWGSGWAICCTSASALAQAAFHSAVEDWPISLVPWEGTWPEDGVGLTVDSTELAREGQTVLGLYEASMDQEDFTFCLYQCRWTLNWFPSYSTLFHPHN